MLSHLSSLRNENNVRMRGKLALLSPLFAWYRSQSFADLEMTTLRLVRRSIVEVPTFKTANKKDVENLWPSGSIPSRVTEAIDSMEEIKDLPRRRFEGIHWVLSNYVKQSSMGAQFVPAT
nr:hypothetical protein L204_04868 [Cryptococcus depauperatus CBS 7855]